MKRASFFWNFQVFFFLVRFLVIFFFFQTVVFLITLTVFREKHAKVSNLTHDGSRKDPDLTFYSLEA
jgi:hypothetical protein